MFAARRLINVWKVTTAEEKTTLSSFSSFSKAETERNRLEETKRKIEALKQKKVQDLEKLKKLENEPIRSSGRTPEELLRAIKEEKARMNIGGPLSPRSQTGDRDGKEGGSKDRDSNSSDRPYSPPRSQRYGDSDEYSIGRDDSSSDSQTDSSRSLQPKSSLLRNQIPLVSSTSSPNLSYNPSLGDSSAIRTNPKRTTVKDQTHLMTSRPKWMDKQGAGGSVSPRSSETKPTPRGEKTNPFATTMNKSKGEKEVAPTGMPNWMAEKKGLIPNQSRENVFSSSPTLGGEIGLDLGPAELDNFNFDSSEFTATNDNNSSLTGKNGKVPSAWGNKNQQPIQQPIQRPLAELPTTLDLDFSDFNVAEFKNDFDEEDKNKNKKGKAGRPVEPELPVFNPSDLGLPSFYLILFELPIYLSISLRLSFQINVPRY